MNMEVQKSKPSRKRTQRNLSRMWLRGESLSDVSKCDMHHFPAEALLADTQLETVLSFTLHSTKDCAPHRHCSFRLGTECR